jgi:hypothetical protein
MRAGIHSLALGCAVAVFCTPSFAGRSGAELPPLVISEIMFNPDGDENAREFVELQNLSGGPVSLEGCRVGDGAAFDPIVPAEGGGWTVPAGEYAVIFDPDYFTSGAPYAGIPDSTMLFTVPDKAIGLRGLSNTSPETVYLLSALGDTLSVVRYSVDCPPGRSWERVVPSGGDGKENFRPSREKEGTPGRRNSVTPPDRNPALGSDAIRFDPSGLRMGGPLDIRISCRNGGLEPISGVTVDVTLLPDIPVGVVSFEEEIPPGESSGERVLHISSLPGGYLALRAVVVTVGGLEYAADDTASASLDVPVPDGTLVLNELMAAPREGPEWVEIMNTGNQPVSLSGWLLGDASGARSHAVPVQRFLPQGEYAILSGGEELSTLPAGAFFIRLAGFPQLNNDGDTVLLIDRSGAVRDSVAYTDAPPGISLELISPSLRGGAHSWDQCVDPSGGTPGRRNSIWFSRVKDGAVSLNAGTELTVTPNPFAETVTISYDLPFPLSRVRLEVYDRRGRRVTVLRDVSESGSTWTTIWDGRTGGSRLPAGAYLLSFEALNKLTGAVVTIRKPLVIARKL